MASKIASLKFSKRDKELLKLISKLILEVNYNFQNDKKLSFKNSQAEEVALSDEEAERLIFLLNDLLKDKSFVQKINFTESLPSIDGKSENSLKEAFLEIRKSQGKSRSFATQHWEDFKARLGIQRSSMSKARKMSFELFKKTEEKLFFVSGIHPDVVKIFSKFVSDNEFNVENFIKREKKIPPGSIRNMIGETIMSLKNKTRLISQKKLIALGVLIANSVPMFATRDLGVLGTISQFCSTAAILLEKEKS